MASTPIIGKHIIDTLTLGMYNDPKIIYREYVQNAVDAIDHGVSLGLYEGGSTPFVNISISPGKVIQIEDNGVGIPQSDAVSRLCDIGNSVKDYRQQRGFRGIGRLGGLAYCSTLKLKTSAHGEKSYTEVVFDCDKLKQLLSPESKDKLSAGDLFENVAVCKQGAEELNKHYFTVTLEDVNNAELLDQNLIFDYLCETCPVDYHSTKFIFSKKVYEAFKNRNMRYEAYTIRLNGKQILKPYTGILDVHGGKKDWIKDIEIFESVYKGSLTWFGWYGVTNFVGAITDQQRGIRIRSRNIQIGDNDFTRIFLPRSNERFHSYMVGEVFVVDKFLIPNARRDSFEPSSTFDLFKTVMTYHFGNFVKNIRDTSQARNNPINKKLNDYEEKLEEVSKTLCNGFSSKKQKLEALEIVKNADDFIKSIDSKVIDGDKALAKTKAKEKIVAVQAELKKVAKGLENDSFFKVDKLSNKFSQRDRNIIREVFDVISSETDTNTSNKLMDSIIVRLNAPSKCIS